MFAEILTMLGLYHLSKSNKNKGLYGDEVINLLESTSDKLEVMNKLMDEINELNKSKE